MVEHSILTIAFIQTGVHVIRVEWVCSDLVPCPFGSWIVVERDQRSFALIVGHLLLCVVDAMSRN
jgi:hypothetical protein